MKRKTIQACVGHTQTIADALHLLVRRFCLWTAYMGSVMVAFGPHSMQAAITEVWSHRFSNVLSNSVDRSQKVARDSAGDIFVTGTSDDNTSGPDLLTIKYSGADGAVLWRQRHRSNPSENAGNYQSGEFPAALAMDSSGNAVVTGSIQYPDGETDYYIAKYAGTDGSLLWEKRYHSTEGDRVRAVAVDNSNNVVVMGSVFTIKFAAVDGGLIWEKSSNFVSDNFTPVMLALDRHGNVLIARTVYMADRSDFYTVKYATVDGALLWQKYSNSPVNSYHGACGVAADPSGNVVVTGSSLTADGPNDYYTVKYAALDGAVLWEKHSSGPTDSSAKPVALAVDDSGNVVVTGSDTAGVNFGYYTVKYAAVDGALLWEKRYNGPTNGADYAQALALDGSGNVVVAGVSSFTDASQGWWILPNFCTIKYAAVDGAVLWERRSDREALFVSGEFPVGNPASVVVDGIGNAIITGNCFTDQGGDIRESSDYFTAKYDAADGAVVWEQIYNGPAHHQADSISVAVDAVGNVAMATSSYLAKYAANNGALLWETRSPASLAQMVMDASGNVAVTGSASYSRTGPRHYYTAKYAASGALLWEKRYNGPFDFMEDYSTALAFDGAGNVVVTGSSPGGHGVPDFYTVKYAAADGVLIWEKRYNVQGTQFDQPRAIAVDGNGDIIVTGKSLGNYYTAKHAGADGSLLWEKRYNKSADDPGRAVAVDAAGNVSVIGRYATLKYAAADGTLMWAKQEIYVSELAVDGSGNVLVTGLSSTRKYAAGNGALLWEKHSTGLDIVAVAVDAVGDVLVSGSTGQPFGSQYTAKYAAADGSLLWESRYKEPVSDWNGAQPHGLALGFNNGMIAIVGSSFSGTFNVSDAITVVYRETLPPIAVDLLPAGVRLRFAGISGLTYNLERAPSVIGPWNTINIQTAPASGLIEYLDTLPLPGSGFYRTMQP